MTVPDSSWLERRLPTGASQWLLSHPEMRKILLNINWMMFDKVADVVIGLTVGVLIARILGPAQYGMVKYVLALTALASSMAGLGLPNLLVRSLVDKGVPEGTLLGTGMVMRGAATFVTMGACVLLLPVMRPESPGLVPLLWMLAAARVVALPGMLTVWFQAEVESKPVVISRIAVVLVFALVKVGMLLSGCSLSWFVAALAFEVAAQAWVLGAVYLRYTSAPIGSWRVRREVAVDLMREGLPLMLTSLMNLIYQRMDQVMIGQLAGDREVGIYAVSAVVIGVMFAVPGFVSWSVFPALVRLREQDPQLYRQRLGLLYGGMLWLALSAATLMTLVAAPMIVVVFGQEYAESAGVLAIQTWALVFFFTGVVGHKHLIAAKRANQLLAMTSLGALVNLVVNLALIPSLGAVGAAIGTVAAFSVSHFLATLLFRETRFLAGFMLRGLALWRVIRDLRAAAAR